MVCLSALSRLAGKLYWPFSLVTTVVAIVAPSFLAVTSTPSMLPSSAEETWPVSVWASAAAVISAKLAVASRRDFSRMVFSLEGWPLCAVDSGMMPHFRMVSPRRTTPRNGERPVFAGRDTMGQQPHQAVFHASACCRWRAGQAPSQWRIRTLATALLGAHDS